jgi:nitroreductase
MSETSPTESRPLHENLAIRNAVTDAITSRRSTRVFRRQAVERETIERLLALASRAPSGSNTQPWRVHVLSGAALRRMTDVLSAAFAADKPETADYHYYPQVWRDPYISRRRATGWGLYKLAGVARGDHEAGKRQRSLNYTFFGAPVGLIFTIDNDLEQGSWLDYGMFLQTLMIAARGFGLDTCPQAAIANYPDLVRDELALPATQIVVCGMALGYADTSATTNTLRTGREPVSTFARFYAS